MLGSMIVDVLSRTDDLAVAATLRQRDIFDRFQHQYPSVRWQQFAFDPTGIADDRMFDGHDWIINAIGITKPLVKDDNPDQIETAIRVNSILPNAVARAAQTRGARVLQIATDCVYSGAKGAYTESDLHDALDVYGKTKSLGETFVPSANHLRCSIIGPEPKDFKFLIEWFRRQPSGAQVNGFRNHLWNGVTTLHFAKLCLGIIRDNIPLPHLQHIVPSGADTKAQMLHSFAEAFVRPDIIIRDLDAQTVIDRTLTTTNHQLNGLLWKAAGYPVPPTISEMIEELGNWDYRMGERAAIA